MMKRIVTLVVLGKEQKVQLVLRAMSEQSSLGSGAMHGGHPWRIHSVDKSMPLLFSYA
jgi:hypothetical protein